MHADVGAAIGNLGQVLMAQDRLAEAEPLLKRAVDIYARAFAPEHLEVARGLHVLGDLYVRMERQDEAQASYERALAMREKLRGPDHEEVAATLIELAALNTTRQRWPDAERLLKRGLAIVEKTYGWDSSSISNPLIELAQVYRETGRPKEAEAALMRALAAMEKSLGKSDVFAAGVHDELARLYVSEKRWSEAYKNASRATTIYVDYGDRLQGKLKDRSLSRDFVQPGEVFFGHVLAAHALAEQQSAKGGPLADEAFRMAQWGSQTDASGALERMAVRFAAGNSELALQVRQRQDLISEWQTKDLRLTAATAEPGDKRDPANEQALRKRLAAIETRLTAIDQTLSSKFPQYVELTGSKPLSIADAQKLLADDEALVLFFSDDKYKPMPEHGLFLWVVTKTEARWERAPLSYTALVESVSALRCGLDETSWVEPTELKSDSSEEKKRKAEQRARAERCRTALKARPESKVVDGVEYSVLPFDLERAHALYQQLFGKIRDVIGGKRLLLLVPYGALSTLPFQVLVTERPAAGETNYTAVAWLGSKQPISVLPSVASLRALRAFAKASQVGRTYIGFGNPLLDGDPSVELHAKLARAARSLQRCADAGRVPVASAKQDRRPLQPVREGQLANRSFLRALTPLPETAEELCKVAQSLGAGEADVRLGQKATESEIKSLNASGALAGYKILHFASHGALAGEIQGNAEAGLVLSPPERPTQEDDGSLSVSEIAELRLDADWVILSACNTAAAAGVRRTEPLSGLARAFFYAGARALLVSHWAVDFGGNGASDPQHRLGLDQPPESWSRRGASAGAARDHCRGRGPGPSGLLGALRGGRRRRGRRLNERALHDEIRKLSSFNHRGETGMIKRFAGTTATRSRAVAHDGIVYAVATAKNKSAPLYEQTKDALAQIDATLAEAGSNKSRILRTTVYITDMSRKPEMDRAWDEWVVFGRLAAAARLHRRHARRQGPGGDPGHGGARLGRSRGRLPLYTRVM